MKGRPKKFDRDAVLLNAMMIFWRKGYANTSLNDLLAGLGIGRQSLYDTYGNKYELFIEALRHYDGFILAHLQTVLDAPGSPLANIHRALDIGATTDIKDRKQGCLINNTVVEFSGRDATVAQIVQAHIAKIEAMFLETLHRAEAAGELTPNPDLRAQARFLTHTMHGIFVMGKAGADHATIADIIRIAFATLKTA